jgi:hypothetical protein
MRRSAMSVFKQTDFGSAKTEIKLRLFFFVCVLRLKGKRMRSAK